MSRCIVTLGCGGWYPKGVDRLERSLIYHGWAEAMHMHRDYPPGCPTHQDVPYGFKLHCIQAARDAGHDQVLWLDTSAWAIQNPLPLFDIIEKQGHYFWTSGYWSGEWCNDRSLEYFGVTRDEAMNIRMLYALCLGFDFRHDRTKAFFDLWQKSLADGMFNGSWKREDGDREDLRYSGHRHDQSCASLIAHQLGMGIDETHYLCHLYEPNMPETVMLTFQGI